LLLVDGGQLASMQDQQDYDRIASLIPNDQVANQFGTVQGNEKCKIVILSRFIALSVSLTWKASLLQRPGITMPDWYLSFWAAR